MFENEQEWKKSVISEVYGYSILNLTEILGLALGFEFLGVDFSADTNIRKGTRISGVRAARRLATGLMSHPWLPRLRAH